MYRTVRYVDETQNAVDGSRCEANYSGKVDIIFWNELDDSLRGRLGLTGTKDKYTSWASLALILRACAQNERSHWGVAEVEMHRARTNTTWNAQNARINATSICYSTY